MRFGPLGQDGGERRLNVLISRAKLQCVVYASITDEDLDPERVKSKGVFALRLFLHFARTGRLDMTRTPDLQRQRSTLIEQASQAIQQRGYIVHPHVGLAGCFVDLGVMHPEVPDRYLLGIEFDGPSYVSAGSSRDRDRLRREVLESHGWSMHRVWACDWLHRPKEQLERCVQAIEAARARIKGLFYPRWTLYARTQSGQPFSAELLKRETAPVQKPEFGFRARWPLAVLSGRVSRLHAAPAQRTMCRPGGP
jgi:hypothetical protein